MRIISGDYKNKKLFLPLDQKTRPLRDLVKESIFNLIEHSNKININLKEAYILDLFSGSGSFGIECLSRQARKVFFLENYLGAIKILEKNLNLLKNNSNYEIINDDFFKFFEKKNMINIKFDIIFIDPPYRELKINNIIEIIKINKLLSEKGIIIIHRHKKDNIKLTDKIKIIENRCYGISNIFFIN
jgi:16S rRNA (guanine966-N2)-methyltransferase